MVYQLRTLFLTTEWCQYPSSSSLCTKYPNKAYNTAAETCDNLEGQNFEIPEDPSQTFAWTVAFELIIFFSLPNFPIFRGRKNSQRLP